MTAKAGQRWSSLGMLIGGHAPIGNDARYYQRSPQASSEQRDEAWAVMEEAGLTPTSRYPESWTKPWQSECITCGLPRIFTVQQVYDGRSCSHRPPA
ncbi:hypothetical protein [Streptomyces filamentosus]|uniref:hypothetical protein n=1 Tax=Streptomyces filamentosus TaxID=67294 RepID=UPI003317140C